MKTQTLIIAKHSYYLSASDLLLPKPTSDIILSQVPLSPTCSTYFIKSDPSYYYISISHCAKWNVG